jgi:hypothetical protein
VERDGDVGEYGCAEGVNGRVVVMRRGEVDRVAMMKVGERTAVSGVRVGSNFYGFAEGALCEKVIRLFTEEAGEADG